MLRPRAPQTRPRADAAGGSNASAQEARGHAGWQAPGLGNVRKWTPCCGRRVGVAAHPGPPSDDPELRRQRKLHALGQMQLLPPDPRPAALRDHHTDADAVETLSDTLSATTVFASPRGDVPPTTFGSDGPNGTRRSDTRLHAATLAWQDARPPSTVPGERNCTCLYVPLLHAAAGNLTARARQAWLSCPRTGPRFDQLVSILREAPPASPAALARTLLLAVAECEAQDEGWRVKQEDRDTATALTALPDARLPLAAAVLLCMAPDGYLMLPHSRRAVHTSRVLRWGHGGTWRVGSGYI